ncbi:MAG TPA: hypothetical protein VJN50_07005 [Actinomycetota bacterium]|nr:hypothetical protein [Actinomycetota bacterium]
MRGRSIVVSALAAVLILATAGEALATVCVNVFDGDLATTGDRIKILNDTFILDVKRRFAQGLALPELPEGAHAAAGCGQAVDDAGECG